MPKLHASESAIIPATPEQVYAVFSDYRNHHPNVLPKQYFTSLEVEEGGQGAGTVFVASLKVFGKEQSFRMRVTEPEPGRHLLETDVKTGLETSFLISPAGQPGHARVEIATRWDQTPGIQGWVERLLLPGTLRKIYRAELAILRDYVSKPLAIQA